MLHARFQPHGGRPQSPRCGPHPRPAERHLLPNRAKISRARTPTSSSWVTYTRATPIFRQSPRFPARVLGHADRDAPRAGEVAEEPVGQYWRMGHLPHDGARGVQVDLPSRIIPT